ncbi:alcohol dehydrogenase catalytic domain-containing protein [Streptomyces somaliensis]|nr:alcohol dehydrogenase catalytic domain-containing protein [Streptomyces somaliensis]
MMKKLLTDLGRHVREELLAYADRGLARRVHGDSPGGDAQFDVDEIAERAVLEFLRKNAEVPLAVYTEDGSLVELAPDPRYVLVVDPIDGTRPTSAGLEMGMVSIAAAPLTTASPTLDDVTAAHLLEIKSGAWIYGDDEEGLSSSGYRHAPPRLSRTTDPARMFWSIEFNGHPMHLMNAAYGHLVDRSANTGGVFVFNSATFSISRIITGQLDSYVDIGNRVLRDHPHTEADFLDAGPGIHPAPLPVRHRRRGLPRQAVRGHHHRRLRRRPGHDRPARPGPHEPEVVHRRGHPRAARTTPRRDPLGPSRHHHPGLGRHGMKALVLTEQRTLSLVDRPKPEAAAPTDVVVKVAQTGICGTDRSVLVGKFPAEPGVVMGHEAVGVVDAVGPAVTRHKPGDRVIINPTLYCGGCPTCLEGHWNFCRNKAGTEVGLDLDGAFAEYIRLPERFIHRMPDGMDFDRASVVEPLACALNNLEAGRLQAGRDRRRRRRRTGGRGVRPARPPLRRPGAADRARPVPPGTVPPGALPHRGRAGRRARPGRDRTRPTRRRRRRHRRQPARTEHGVRRRPRPRRHHGLQQQRLGDRAAPVPPPARPAHHRGGRLQQPAVPHRDRTGPLAAAGEADHPPLPPGGARRGLRRPRPGTRRAVLRPQGRPRPGTGRSHRMTPPPFASLLPGTDRPVVIGEYPYYRAKPERWAPNLRELRRLGVDVVSCYLPWRFHETLAPGGERAFDFTGTTDPQRDVAGLLTAARETGLRVLLKPGPFIHAEVQLGGLPDRLCGPDRTPYTGLHGRTLTSQAKPLPSLFDPDVRDEAAVWLRAVADRVIAPALAPHGPVVAVQLGNEGICGDAHLPIDSQDAGPHARAAFAEWLAGRGAGDLAPLVPDDAERWPLELRPLWSQWAGRAIADVWDWLAGFVPDGVAKVVNVPLAPVAAPNPPSTPGPPAPAPSPARGTTWATPSGWATRARSRSPSAPICSASGSGAPTSSKPTGASPGPTAASPRPASRCSTPCWR